MGESGQIWTELEQLYEDLDRKVAELTLRHADRLRCRLGCTDCCVDGIGVFEIEAERIRHRHPDLLRNEAPHPEGACAFLDSRGACRIYESRPYVCRTQGLPLSWVESSPGAPPLDLRDICPLNDGDPPLESLDVDDCWRIGPFEGRLAELQARLNGGHLRRVSLRELFAR